MYLSCAYMTLLLIDTSQPEARVVLAHKHIVLAERSWDSGQDLSTRLLQALSAVLHESHMALDHIDRIAVNQGPGSFSALRTGVVVATLLSFAVGLELVAVDTGAMKHILSEAGMAQPTTIIKPRYE